jgi:hypothetical protein
MIAGALVQFLYPLLMGIGFETTNLMMMFSAFLAGAAVIYVAAWVAPTERKFLIAIIMIAVSLLNYGVAIYYDPDFVNILITSLQNVGSIFMGVLIYRGETNFPTP